jgi:transketolase
MAGFTYSTFEPSIPGNARELVALKLLELMETNKDIVYLFADAASKANTQGKIMQKFPDRTIEVGIAESNLVGAAAGIALAGKKPFVMTFGSFLSLRATEQICLDVAYNEVPVCLIGTHSGITSDGGPTHHSILDCSIMRAIPNLTLVAPSDANQSLKIIEDFIKEGKPTYMRIPRGGDEPLVYSSQDYDFKLGKAVVTKEGKDAAIIASGSSVYHSLKAAEELEKEGINIRVLDMFTLKPIDTEAVIKAAKETGIVLTVEDHNVLGGLGSAVAEVICEAGITCKFKRLGVPDEFSKLGNAKTLYPYYGLDSVGIVKTMKAIMT